MKEVLNANTFFNTVAMIRQDISALLLIVEGEDDYFVLKSHNSEDLHLLPGVGGRANLLAAAELADKRMLSGVKFLIDSDYDAFVASGRSYPSNVITSKTHDVFMDMIVVGSKVIDRVIESHSRAVGRSSGPALVATAVRNEAVILAARLAPLRIANERHGLGLNLSKFPFGSLTSLEPLDDEIAKLAIGRSNTSLSEINLVAHIKAESAHRSVDSVAVVGDHDFFRALSRVLEEKGARSTSDSLFSSFLAALSCDQVVATDWYVELEGWAAVNGMGAFACPCAV